MSPRAPVSFRPPPAHAPPPRSAAGRARRSLEARESFRPEVQGLRAVAILMVVCYHIWFGRVSGGVDIFLLVSAFLLTESFARTLEARRPVGVVAYWARTFKRLLPPAVVTVLGTVALVWWLFPPSRVREVLDQAVASLLYYENWYLAAAQVDYYAADHAQASPLQHFWSLSIQGQVFVLWPMLFALVALLSRVLRWRVRPVALVVFGAVFAASLAWSMVSTATQQQVAYFDTFTRLWEFALGSLLALALPWLERALRFGDHADRAAPEHRAVANGRVIAGWVALAAILACGFVVDVEGAFPGWIALWPTLAACTVIAAGATGSPIGVDRLLASAALRRLGDLSYALYLVHWPLLITLLVIRDDRPVDAVTGLALVVTSIALAWVLTALVDAPLRYWPWANARWWRAAVVAALVVALGLLPVRGLVASLDAREAVFRARADVDNPGAMTLLPGWAPHPDADPDAPALPLPADVEHDWVSLGAPCAGEVRPADPDVATACAVGDWEPGDRTIVVVGSSRAEQYMAALRPLAREHGWRMISLLRGGCAYGDPSGDCAAWNRAVTDYLLALSPDAVAAITTQIPAGGGDERLAPGIGAAVGELTGAGIDVIGLRDMPRFAESPTACLGDGGTVEACTAAEPQYAPTDPAAALAARHAGSAAGVGPAADVGRMVQVDPAPWICPGGACPPVIGNVRVYLDQNHLTGTYAATMAPLVERELAEARWQW